ncbi:Glycosyltransferase involved in cell wall bisynthesis [Bosea sp. CRIB-10]|uniref:glycosyltransferase family 4 protein n=1 Tax=Bosea sp. CRIB-10 TaxID=378404 RepID=UPI0008F3B960|nr:glycosyltransferase family 4 protein [Bosea sp. CRIB-10]SFC70373.1 Glycosyltransferase involved in cell wall bisynthesis [Bosea sp. CRIB-10]
MKIAFHTPLNRYGDGVPSGDRLMAHQLVTLLEELGHAVEIIPAERSFMREPDPALLAALKDAARGVIAALTERWQTPQARPDLFFTYHCHYRAPDLIGPALVEHFDLPYLLAEASDAQKRFTGPWSEAAALARAAILRADLHLCMTARDREGLSRLIPEADRLIDLPPFLLGVEEISEHSAAPRDGNEPVQLIAVAMMRQGNKAACYLFLARTLARIADLPWTLTLIGDGPERPAIEAAFAGFPPGRVRFLGKQTRADILAQLATHDLFVWPGLNEAYGVVYLEAQAAGLPVAALDSGGVPAVVAQDRSALLAPHGDEAGLAATIARLIGDPALRARMGAAAQGFARRERNGDSARAILAAALAAASARHSSTTVRGAP